MNVTIQITDETKQLIRRFGSKTDSYDTILRKIYELAIRTQMREFYLASASCIPIDEAISRVKKS